MYLDHVYVLIFLFFPCFRIISTFVWILFTILNFSRKKNSNNFYSIFTWCSLHSYEKVHGLLQCSNMRSCGICTVKTNWVFNDRNSVWKEIAYSTPFCVVIDVEMEIGYVHSIHFIQNLNRIKFDENVQKGSMMIMWSMNANSTS